MDLLTSVRGEVGKLRWPKKSKLVMEERVATAGSAVEDGFNSPNDSHSDPIDDGLGGVDFDDDSYERKVQISSGLDDEEQNLWQEVSVKNKEEKEGRKKGNVEGSVLK